MGKDEDLDVSRNYREGIKSAAVWILGVVLPGYLMHTAETAGEFTVGATALVLVCTSAIGAHRTTHPDRPAWKDRPPGLSRTMMKWQHEYEEAMEDRSDEGQVSFEEWLNEEKRPARGHRLRSWLRKRSGEQ